MNVRRTTQALAARARALADRGRAAAAALVACVGAIEARDLHLAHGHPSLYAYCRDALALSEHDAYCVVAAARAARRFPAVLALLADGGLTLTTVKLLAPHLTPENVARVLEAARGKRRAQVEEIVALLVPQEEPPPELRRLAAPAVRPTAADRFRLQVTIGGAAVEKLRCAQDLLRHVDPRGDEAAVVERALGALVSALARRKFAATGRAPRERAAGGRLAPRPGGGEARRLRARPRPLRVRRGVRPALRHARVPGVPPRAPVRGRRRARPPATSSCAAAATTTTRRARTSGPRATRVR